MRRVRGLTLMDPLLLAFRAGNKDVTRRMGDPGWKPGDVVPVLEALVPVADEEDVEQVWYRADNAIHPSLTVWPWKVRVLPARYCPTRFARDHVEIVSVRPEPLSAIEQPDVAREGVTVAFGWADTVDFINGFRKLHKLPCDADPVVARIEFRRVSP